VLRLRSGLISVSGTTTKKIRIDETASVMETSGTSMTKDATEKVMFLQNWELTNRWTKCIENRVISRFCQNVQ
jgi:hypothetical protein